MDQIGKKAVFEETLEALRRRDLFREEAVLSSPRQGSTIRVDGRRLIDLSSNDYLGLASHPEIIAAACRAAKTWGSGSRASRLICGTTQLHRELEEKLCAFLDVEACLVFGSGYLANTGLFHALTAPGDRIYSDRFNHASIVDGCRLSKADVRIFDHCDADDLERCLQEDAGGGRKMIVTETTFSMDGDEAPLRDIAAAASRYEALTAVDEAHSFGIKGQQGRGLNTFLPLPERPDIIMGTFSKAVGAYGAFIATSKEIKKVLINRCRTLIYSTALPPPVIGAALRGIEMISGDEGGVLRERLQRNCAELKEVIELSGWPLMAGDGPIFLIEAENAGHAVATERRLREQGVFLRAIRYPTVPEGTERLRIVAGAQLTEKDLDDTLEALRAVR